MLEPREQTREFISNKHLQHYTLRTNLNNVGFVNDCIQKAILYNYLK